MVTSDYRGTDLAHLLRAYERGDDLECLTDFAGPRAAARRAPIASVLSTATPIAMWPCTAGRRDANIGAMRASLLAILLLALTCHSAVAQDRIPATVTDIVDGDTIKVQPDVGPVIT